MNAKFRMPKLGRKVKMGGVVKELLLTTIATTISIVLTFGTAAWLEKKEANKARRLLAMTIISDIDLSLEVVKNRIRYEDECRSISYYLMWNLHRLEEIGPDSILTFLNYVTNSGFPTELEMETSNEHIFNSSQDSWRTLSDKKFLSNVQDFYSARALCERQRKESVYFQKPISMEEEYNLVMESDDMKTDEAVLATCRRLLQTPRVQNYIGWSSERKSLYDALMRYINVNEENKFLMGITEKELEDFRNQSLMVVRRAKEADLVGTWDAVLTSEDNHTEYTFRKDHTFSTLQTKKWNHYCFRGKITTQITVSGHWKIVGDTLVKTFDKQTFKIENDESGITCSKEERENQLPEVRQHMMEKFKERGILKRINSDTRMAQATNLDRTGTRLELTETGKPPVHYQRRVGNGE
jgi:hypothetical protein